jgi:hypothetical protein
VVQLDHPEGQSGQAGVSSWSWRVRASGPDIAGLPGKVGDDQCIDRLNARTTAGCRSRRWPSRSAHSAPSSASPRPVLERTLKLIQRGQDSGDIDATLPPAWLLTAGLALGRAVGEAVKAGRMTVRFGDRKLGT